MLIEALPVTDIYWTEFGSLCISLYKGDNPDMVAEPDDSAIVTIEDITKEFVKECREDSGFIEYHENIQVAYNIIDSLRDCIKMIEGAIDDEDDVLPNGNR